METTISYQTYDVNTDTTGMSTVTVDHAVDSLSEAKRIAETHAAEQAGPGVLLDVDVIATGGPDGRDLVDEWEDTYADEL
ncbi:hypothetical protein OHQ88_10445 [Micromonospora zamorensis]|uniref:hypothetical protein n=1 Tax=Micromonospora zamorensis TaxID=709883 RepID=UPI002E23D8E1